MNNVNRRTICQLIPLILTSMTIVMINGEERVVTDIGVVQSPAGVPLDFSYNQSMSEVHGGLISMPGCPKSIDGYPWVYYGNPPRCHLAGHQGPCPQQMSLFLETGSQFGICNCDCFKDEHRIVEDSADEQYRLCKSNSPLNHNGVAYDKQSKTCYPLGQQGTCDEAKWLVLDRDQSTVICVPECPPDSPKYYDSVTGQCKHIPPSSIPSTPSPCLSCSLTPQECVPPKKYSKLWGGCIDRPEDFLFLN